MTEAVERDCNTCQHHVQGCSLDDIPERCWDCVGHNYAAYASDLPKLPLWQPIVSTKKETPMSGGMEDAARMEAEEAELSVLREAVAPIDRVFMTPGQIQNENNLRMIYGAKPLEGTVKPEVDPLKAQVGGSHYKSFKIQPIEFAIANRLDFFQKDILKYITRRKGDKAKRIEDLNKAIHYAQLYIQAIDKGDIE